MTDVFTSTPVAHVLQLYDGLVDEQAWTRTAREQVEILAIRLVDGVRAKEPGAAVELHNWFPNAARRSTEELFDLALSIDDAREAVSRAHGFAGWQTVVSDGDRPEDAVFERAVERLLSGDIPAVDAALARTRDLVTRRSHYGHRATLLHYLAANGVETYRQRVPRNAAEIAALLLQHGADPHATAMMYGGPQTTRSMLISSAHPFLAGVGNDLLGVLDRGTGAA